MPSMTQWRDTVVALSGWRRRGAAFLCGAAAVLAMPPVHFVPALVPAFVGLAWLIDGARRSNKPRRRWQRLGRVLGSAGWDAYRAGWWFGAGFFLFGLYWVSFSFLVDAARFAWMIPFALAGVAGGFAIYIGLTALATFKLCGEGTARLAMLAFWWVVFEWLRGWLFTGFPWNLMGTVWTFSDSMIQLTAITGVFGLSLVTAAAAAPAVFGMRAASGFRRWRLVLLTYGVLAAVWAGGAARLSGASDDMVDGVRLRLVQPNIAQRDKWRRELRPRHMKNLLSLSRSEDGPAPTHVIWPETAVPGFIESGSPAARGAAAAVPPGGVLLSGAARYIGRAGGGPFLWNSLHIIDENAEFLGTYDKYHLVPFGEYVPFRKFLPVAKLTAGRVDFSPGPGPAVLAVPGAPPVSPLICFEAIFPGRVVAEAGKRPGWLLNVTNDAWFGVSSGPYQHFAAVRLRAAEEGMPLVRVANTGISAVVDPYGRVLVRTKLEERIAIDSSLPKALASKTIYTRMSYISVLLTLLLYISVFPGFPLLYYIGRLRNK